MSLKKVIQYNELLPKKLRYDILNYHTDKDYQPNVCMLPPRTGHTNTCDIDSVIIDKKQAEWILLKIVESTSQLQANQRISMKQDNVYKLTLLYRQSRDGNTKFRELCNNKGPTIAAGKVLNTEEILGGYNPFAWGSQEGYAKTKESFIFALDKNVDKSIVSFAHNFSSWAINDRSDCFPVFGGGYDFFLGQLILVTNLMLRKIHTKFQ